MIDYFKKNSLSLLFIILASYAYLTSLLIGISFDELFVIARGEERLKYLYSLGNSKITYDHNQFFPGLYDTIAIFFTQLFPKKYTISSLHLVNTTFSILTLIGTYKLSKLIFNKVVAIIFILIIYFNPIFFGHMAMNSKDTIIVFSFVWLLVTFLKYLKYQNNPTKHKKLVLYACLFLSLGLGTRIQFFGLLIFFLPFLLVKNKIKNKNFSYKIFIKDFFIIGFISYFFMIAAWPHVHSNIFTAPFNFFVESLNLKNGPPTVLFNGEVFDPGKVPYTYFFSNLLYRSPEYIIVLYIIFISTFLFDYKFYKKNVNDFNLIISVSLLITLFPTILMILTDIRVFDGIRYFLFIIPFYSVVPSVTVYYLIKKTKSIYVKFNLTLICILVIFYISVFIKINPYQYTFINSFVLNEKKIQNKFENDYWGISLREIVKKISKYENINLINNKSIGVCGFYNPIFLLEIKKFPELNIVPVGLYGNDKIDFIITNNRSHYFKMDENNKEWVNCDNYFDGETLIDVKTNKVTLSKFKKVN